MATFLLSWLSRRYAALDATVFLRELPGEWLVLESVPGSPRRASEPLATRISLRHGRSLFALGRDPAADLVVDGPDVSPTHAILESDRDGSWTIRRASEGTPALLDGLQIGGFPVALGSGARIDLGGARLTYYSGPDLHARMLEGNPASLTPSEPPPPSPAPPR